MIVEYKITTKEPFTTLDSKVLFKLSKIIMKKTKCKEVSIVQSKLRENEELGTIKIRTNEERSCNE